MSDPVICEVIYQPGPVFVSIGGSTVSLRSAATHDASDFDAAGAADAARAAAILASAPSTTITFPGFGSSAPSAPGVAAPGTATTAAHSDHVHPEQLSVSGNSGTVTGATFTTSLTVNTGTVTLSGSSANTSVLTIGPGAVLVSGSNTGDQNLSGLLVKASNLSDLTNKPTALTNLGAGSFGSSMFGASDRGAANALLNAPRGLKMKIIETDFVNSNVSFAGSQDLFYTAISSGTTAIGTGSANHPGVWTLKDSTTGGGGGRWMSDVSQFVIGGGETCAFVFQINTTRSGQIVRMGFQNATTAAAPTDGVCIDMVGDGSTGAVVTGRCYNNSSNTATGTTYTCLVNTWYTGTIVVNAAATSVTFTIYSESGAQLWQSTVATNIPTARTTGFGLVGTESTSDAAATMFSIDYLKMEIFRDLAR